MTDIYDPITDPLPLMRLDTPRRETLRRLRLETANFESLIAQMEVRGTTQNLNRVLQAQTRMTNQLQVLLAPTRAEIRRREAVLRAAAAPSGQPA